MPIDTLEIPLLSLLPHAAEEDHAESPISEALRRMVASLVLDTTSEGIWLIDAASRTTFVNQHTASLLGYSVADMLGVALTTFMDDEGRQICERNLERRRNGIEEQHEFSFMRKDGTVVWTLLATNPVYDRHGNYAGALAMVANLSEQKLRERRLSDRVEELERELAARAPSAAPAARPTDSNWLDSLAAVDASTVLADRRYFTARVAAALSQKYASARGCSVLLLSLDGFRALAGHGGGEGLLRAIVTALSAGMGTPQGLLQAPDTLARLAGDGFAILAAETGLQEAVDLAERVCEVVCEVTSVVLGEANLVSASIGVATYPLHATGCTELLAAADGALRDAQQTEGGAIGIASIPRMRLFGTQGERDLVQHTQSSRPAAARHGGALGSQRTAADALVDEPTVAARDAHTLAPPSKIPVDGQL